MKTFPKRKMTTLEIGDIQAVDLMIFIFQNIKTKIMATIIY